MHQVFYIIKKYIFLLFTESAHRWKYLFIQIKPPDQLVAIPRYNISMNYPSHTSGRI